MFSREFCLNRNNYDYYRNNNYKRHKHYHEIGGVTSQTKEHDHEYYDKTIKTIGKDEKHIHYYKINTSFDNRHSHKMVGKTGPAISIDYDRHIHFIDGMTSLDNGHVHFYEEYTSPDIIN